MSNVRIQDDLFEAVNGEWLKTAVIPDDRPSTGGFNNLAEDVEKTMMADFRAFANGTKTTDVPYVEEAVKLYQKVMDTTRRNEEGIQPVLPTLHRIQEIKSIQDLNEHACDLFLNVMPAPIEFGVAENMQDATKNCFMVKGPSIILPDTVYYNPENPAKEQLLGVYSQMAKAVLAHTDLTEQQQEQYLQDALAFDEIIAKHVKSRLEWADYVTCHNPYPTEKVCEHLQPLNFKKLLEDLYPTVTLDEIIVYEPRAIEEFAQYFNEETFPLYLHWAYVKTLLSATEYLSEELAALGTTYQRTLTGVQSDPALEKQAYLKAGGVFSEPVGVYYGRTYFGEEAKKDITNLVKRVIEMYKKRVANNTFLEEATKQKALLKLSTIAIKMGYPDAPNKKYAALHVDENDSYYATMTKFNQLNDKESFEKLTKPVDKNEWRMPGHMVNACYDPTRNDITFPAAILQKPFYSINQSISENLGGIGAVIAHEISHAFDNNGSHFDENGNLFNWWTENDFASFKKLTADMIEQWDGIPFAGGTVNGELVVSENIADNGGLAITLEIMHEIEGASFEDYFKNWGRIWCMKAHEEYMALLLSMDVHSPAKLRANVAVRNFQEWYDTFNVTADDEMYIAPEKRIIIW